MGKKGKQRLLRAKRTVEKKIKNEKTKTNVLEKTKRWKRKKRDPFDLSSSSSEEDDGTEKIEIEKIPIPALIEVDEQIVRKAVKRKAGDKSKTKKNKRRKRNSPAFLSLSSSSQDQEVDVTISIENREEEEEKEAAFQLRERNRKDDCDLICSSLPGRRKQIEMLFSLLSDVPAPFLYVWGMASTGKTAVVQGVLKSLHVAYAFVSCVECYSQSLLYETILHQLSGFADVDCAFKSCTTMNDFIHELKSIQLKLSRQSLCLALDKAERLLQMNPALPQALARLHEIVDLNISIIFITRVEFEKFWHNTGLPPPLQITFPKYSEDNMVDILALDCPDDQQTSFFRRFIQLLCSVCRLVCQDIAEWRYLVTKVYPKYIEPVRSGKISEDNASQLFAHVKPYLHEIFGCLYHFSSTSVEAVELPYYGSFVLIAAYLASHNPPKSDSQMFGKKTKKRTIREKQAKKRHKGDRKFVEPKRFSLERILAIFYSILSIIRDDVRPPISIVQEHISSLVHLGLLDSFSGKSNCLENPKYICHSTFQFVQSAARTVGFDIAHYLLDA